MKRTVQINLAGVPFTVDDDAYRKLDAYLLDLEQYFAKSGNQEEIMGDIEARMAELLNDLIKSRRIVEMTDVEAAIKVMGTPTDFEETTAADGRPWDIRTGKRLFRDPEDKVIGGVCSGLAAYFGIEEVIWIRLAFLLVLLTMGVGVVVYIVMWILVPEAKTASDRLAMMGEPANARNIGSMVERSIENISSTIQDNWKEWNTKKKHRREKRRKEGRDRPVYVLAVFLVPIVLLLRVIQVLGRFIRRGLTSRKMAFRNNQFV